MASNYDNISTCESESCNMYLLDPASDSFPVYFIRQRTRFRRLRRQPCRYPKRLILKNGRPRLHKIKRAFLAVIYIHDLVNTLINSSWKWTLMAISLVYMSTWLLFAYIWMMISLNSDDVDVNNGTNSACLHGIQSFAGYLMFSIETQTSIGYGSRYISHHCPEAIVLFCIQILTGTGVCGLFISIVYEKLSGPERFAAQSCFSKYGVICQRDGQFCLIIRIRDIRRKYQIKNTVNAYVLQRRNGEPILKTIKLEPFGILIWPNELVHLINSDSPFWDLSAKDLILNRFEIIVSMEGTCLSTSKMSNVTASYLSTEILWGHKFKPCVFYDKEQEGYRVDHGLFHKTKQTTMPLCSARRLKEVCEDIMILKQYCTYSSSFITDSTCNDSLDGVVISPVAVHVTDDNNSQNRKFQCNDKQMEALLFRLQKFLQENDGLTKYNYIETSL